MGGKHCAPELHPSPWHCTLNSENTSADSHGVGNLASLLLLTAGEVCEEACCDVSCHVSCHVDDDCHGSVPHAVSSSLNSWRSIIKSVVKMGFQSCSLCAASGTEGETSKTLVGSGNRPIKPAQNFTCCVTGQSQDSQLLFLIKIQRTVLNPCWAEALSTWDLPGSHGLAPRVCPCESLQLVLFLLLCIFTISA